jgi:hypothetical protein
LSPPGLGLKEVLERGSRRLGRVLLLLQLWNANTKLAKTWDLEAKVKMRQKVYPQHGSANP